MPRTGGRHDGEHEGRGRTRAPVIPADLKNWPAAGRPAAEALGRGGEGKLYASRRDARSDWYQNLLKNPEVTVEIPGAAIRRNGPTCYGRGIVSENFSAEIQGRPWPGEEDRDRDQPTRRLALPLAIQRSSLTSLQRRLFKTGARLVRHARYYRLQLAESQLAESHLTQRLFGQILGRIERLPWHPT